MRAHSVLGVPLRDSVQVSCLRVVGQAFRRGLVASEHSLGSSTLLRSEHDHVHGNHAAQSVHRPRVDEEETRVLFRSGDAVCM